VKEIYLDIMEKSLAAYTPERIRDYIDEVRCGDLKEHGFPRLGSNIGILMAHGRRLDLKDVFVKIMDLCCYWIPRSREEDAHFGNNFSIRELCCCFMLLQKVGNCLPQLSLCCRVFLSFSHVRGGLSRNF